MPQSSEIVGYCAYRDCAGTVRSDAHLYSIMRAHAGATWPEEPVQGVIYPLGASPRGFAAEETPTIPRNVLHRAIGDPTFRASSRERGCFLSFLLVARMALDLIAISSILTNLPRGSANPTTACIVPLIIAGLVVELIFTWGIWQWQRWGVFGTVIFSSVAILLEALSGYLLALPIGVGGLLLLLALIRPHWDQME